MATLTKEALHLLLQDKLKRVQERNLSAFIRGAWPIIEPGKKFLSNWHIDLIADYLKAVREGQMQRLIINIPPRHMKSISVTVMFPSWCWATWPEARFLFASYAHNLSVKHSIDRRSIIESEWFQNNWPLAMMADQNVKHEFQNVKRGVMFSTSIGGSATGKGGDIIIVDDPHNPLTAASDAERTSALSFIDGTLSTRLDNPKTGSIIVVMQRLHEEDASGHLLAQGGWEHLKVPAIEPQDKVYSFPTQPDKKYKRLRDELLWVERFDEKYMAGMHVSLGSYGFAGQMQQEPAPAEGAMMKRAWFIDNLWGTTPEMFDAEAKSLAAKATTVIQSWDCTFKDTDGTDYVVGQVWACLNADKWLLDQVRARMTLPETVHALRSLKAKWPETGAILVEEKANGAAVIQTLRREIPGIIPIIPLGGKEVRVSATSPDMEAGNVHLPRHAAWADDNINEACMFPKGKHDDTVDSMTQAIIRLNASAGIIAYYTQGRLDEETAEAERKAREEGVMTVTHTTHSDFGEDLHDFDS